jgi:hypothetical protein
MRLRTGRAFGALTLVIALAACHREATAPAVAPSAAPSAPDDARSDAARAAAPATSQPDAGPAAEPVAEPIDLLRALRTDVAVSSAYRDKQAQAVNLIDGDLETAWNSRTGDLVGAWIEVRLPEEASVTSIALTAGFTKRTAQSDLFTGNHRVSKVRVLHAAKELGVFPLDVESRELQTLPVEGAGGLYRIEVVEVVPGTKAQWREVCVSELRIMGRAPGATEGLRLPRVAVGAMPEPRPEPGTTDRAAVGDQLRKLVPWFATEWGAINDEEAFRGESSALDDEDMMATSSWLLRRRQLFAKVAGLVELVDEVRADQLRLASLADPPDEWWALTDAGDHGLLMAGVGAVVDWLGDDDARCRWARASVKFSLGRVLGEFRKMSFLCAMSTDLVNHPDPVPRDVDRQCGQLERLQPRVEDLASEWDGNPRAAAEKIRRFEHPELAEGAQARWAALQSELGAPAVSTLSKGRPYDDWAAARAQVELARSSCGWVRDTPGSPGADAN